MARSYNGFRASKIKAVIGVRPFVVAGVSFPGGVRRGNVAAVLGYVAAQYDARVEPLRPGWCWGYSFRENRNADNLSCHASGTAIDCNAPLHPNGVAVAHTFRADQVAEIHRILAEVDHVVTWGGDFHHTVDAMHFEISGTAAQVRAVARRLKEDDVTPQDIDKVADAVVEKLLGHDMKVRTLGGKQKRVTVFKAIQRAANASTENLATLRDRARQSAGKGR